MFGVVHQLFGHYPKSLEALSRPTFVLGSGPNALPPELPRSDFTFATVNASQAAATSWNLGMPDVTLFGAGVLSKRPVNVAAKSALEGQRTKTLLFIGREKRRSYVKQKTAMNRFDFEKLIMFSRTDRKRLVKRVTGHSYDDGYKISNGIFLAILALYMRSPKVVMSGFSLSSHGHSYNDFGHKRAHISADSRVLAEIARRGLNLFTNDPVFATESGLRCVKF